MLDRSAVDLRYHHWVGLNQRRVDGLCPFGDVLGFSASKRRSARRARGSSTFCRLIAGILSAASISAVGINISVASILVLAHSIWWALFTSFVGGAMVWFAATGYCIMANALYWLGAEPRLNPEAMPSGRCANCAMSPVCISNPHAERVNI